VVYTVFAVVVISAITPAVELCTEVDNRSTPGIYDTCVDDTCVVAGNAPSEVVETSVVYTALAVVGSHFSNLASSITLPRR
jgi:hypothetical protein